MIAAAAIAGVGGRALASIAGRGGRALPGLVGGVVFLVLYLVAAAALGSRELAELAAPIRRLKSGLRPARFVSSTASNRG
jgi:hypothetical protein